MEESNIKEAIETIIANKSKTKIEGPNYIYFVPKNLRPTGRYNAKRIKQREDYRMKNS